MNRHEWSPNAEERRHSVTSTTGHGLFRILFEARRCCQMMKVMKVKSMTDRKPANNACSCGLDIFSRRTVRARRKAIARRRF